MSQPTYPPQPPVEDPQAPRTQQLPAGPPSHQPHPASPYPGMTGPQEYRVPQGYDPAFPAQPTGPMDWVPGFSGAQPASSPGNPGPGQDTGRAPTVGASRRSPDRAALTATGLGVLGALLLQLGLGTTAVPLWSAVTTWSLFATAASLLVLAPLVPGRVGLSRRLATRLGLAGLAGLAAFWLLVALPMAASDRGFWLTAGVALAAVALWLSPTRTRPPALIR